MIVYDRLWLTMKKKQITKYTLRKKYNISSSLIHRMMKGQPISTYTLDNLCKILDCKVEDIIEHIPDKEQIT
jgi:DNA-binding Xre family transcriptional regulator